VEPDISIICDKSKMNDKGCVGAPDWIIEIVSPSTQHMDYGIKLFKYRTAGVREYWIVNPIKHTINVYDFDQDKFTSLYSFDEDVPVCIFENLSVNM
jgi:Uma2 family endonuclease